MTINAEGYLDSDLHSMNIDDMEKTFVTLFPHSSTRRNILDDYKKHTADLVNLINEYMQFLDGSFVSNETILATLISYVSSMGRRASHRERVQPARD